MIPIPLEEAPRTNCCGAKFYEETDLCSDCKEHADVAEEEHEVAPIIKEIFKDRSSKEKMTREKLIDKLEQMPELEHEDELIHKRMNDINTFQAHENEVYLRGTDEYGKDFQICFDSYNFLEWIDTEHLEYIKEQLTKYIKTK